MGVSCAVSFLKSQNFHESITRAGPLALVDYSQVARTCILQAFGLQMPWRLSLVLPLFCFASFSSLCFR